MTRSMPSRLIDRLIFGTALCHLAFAASGQVRHIESAPPNLVESGEPPLVVLSAQNLGLRSAPTDIHRLKDGRLFLLAGSELAFGDGIRWQVFTHVFADGPGDITSVAIDDDGTIYAGMPGGFGHIEINESRQWRLVFDAPTPPEVRESMGTANRVITVGDRWFWDAGSGAVLSWRPGQKAATFANPEIVERVFQFRDGYYLSDWGAGNLTRVQDGKLSEVISAGEITFAHVITCTVPYDEDHLLVGTHSRGLRLFDGTTMAPFENSGLLADSRRINDLCAIEGGMYAAAIANFGIVFFDHSGKIVQVIEQTIDRRLSNVLHLLPTPDGVVWALLKDGIAAVRFPVQSTEMAPLVSTPLLTVYPYRLDGKLWLHADGIVHRGVYDRNGILKSFEVDTPPGHVAFSLSMVPGWPLVGTEAGFFGKFDGEWERLDPEVSNGRILSDEPINGRWFYGARGEVGWITFEDDHLSVESYPVPNLPEVHGARTGADGIVWIELGAGIVARADLKSGTPGIEMFGRENGLPPNWAQLFEVDGIVRVNAGRRILRFDEARRYFVNDDDFVRRYRTAKPIYGRPGRDETGRLWMATEEGVFVIEDDDGEPRMIERHKSPLYFTFEKNGVAWMQSPASLIRFDPSIHAVPSTKRRTLITSVHLPTSNQTIFIKNDRLPPLQYEDNSLEVAFLSTGEPFDSPVTFDVILDGPAGTMTSSNISPPAVFNQLGEGDYVLRVRPKTADSANDTAFLAFSILAPWYRTIYAYIGYLLGGMAVVLVVAWSVSYFEGREKARLEAVVGERTRELYEANRQLEGKIDESIRQADELRAGEERFRRLNEELEKRVDDRTRELNRTNERLQESLNELEAFSYSISHDLRAPLRNIRGFSDLLQKRDADNLEGESKRFLGIVSSEATRLNDLISSLLAFSRLNRAVLKPAEVDLLELSRAVIEEFRSDFAGRQVEWVFGDLPKASGDPTLLRQVLANLIGNALKFTRGRAPARIEIGFEPEDSNRDEVVYYVRDNGIGFVDAYAEKAFGVFQRLHSGTEFEGTGIGLAIVRRIISRHGGRVWAVGAPNEGATVYFTLRNG